MKPCVCICMACRCVDEEKKDDFDLTREVWFGRWSLTNLVGIFPDSWTHVKSPDGNTVDLSVQGLVSFRICLTL